jgi:glutathione synthase/RimK-type ligase-like ATP-grasp enzyme
MKTKKIALMDKYASNFTEGENFIGYAKGFLDSGCEVFQLDPYTIDFTNKEGRVNSLVWSKDNHLQRDTLKEYKKLKDFDILVDLSDLVNYDFSRNIIKLKGFLMINNKLKMYDSADKRTYIKNYPEFIPKTIVSSKINQLEKALKNTFKGRMIVKDPLGSCGNSVEKVEQGENYLPILKKLTKNETFPIVAQDFLTFAHEGTKRVAVIGNPKKPESYKIIHFYGRKHPNGDWKDNLSQGGEVLEIDSLREDEKNLCLEIAKRSGLYVMGLDIGDTQEKGKRIPKLIETNSVLSFSANGKYTHKLKKVTDFILNLK